MAESYAHETISSLNSAVALSPPAGAQSAWVQAVGGACRFKLDGTLPTTSAGPVLANALLANYQHELHDATQMRHFRVIKNGSDSPTLEVTYRCVT